MEFGHDARKAAATRTWLVTAFVAAARKRQDFATARLLAIRPAALAATTAADAPAPAAPSLEDFAAEHDPDGFYTEKELLDLFAAQHAGADTDASANLRRQQRNARLRARQMAALEALARLVGEDPRPEHVLGWFDTAVALRLADIGLTTIGKLVETINAVGYRWYINSFPPDPQPASQWVMAGTAHRGDLAWRPFRGPLSVKSRQDALSALKKFFGELVNAQYLDHNAFAKVRVFTGSTHDDAGNERRVAAKSRLQIERGLTTDAWRFAMRVLDAMPDTAAATRMRFVLSFAYSTGLRRAELCGAFTDDVQGRYAGPELGTIRLLRVVGKRAKERFVPLVPAMLDLMGDYLGSRGLPRDPLACPAATPLIPALLSNAEVGQILRAAKTSKADPAPELAARARQTGPIHPVQLYKAIKQFFAMATAAALREDSPHARAFSTASPHWLRHTFVSHALANGMSLESARNFAGHDSLDTTSIYATAELGRQYREAEKFLSSCAAWQSR
ncbi:hypothetical protein AQ477_18020 (plasmid) [Burkholderia thailandensis]|nr:hypothetical protein AQ477_18020 [Burkholderia thailandensis]KXF59772.1 hypothetical protein AQ476_18295 [Burkholderia thailandensis]PNE73182.1 integrase [Burkholderia thailandensis]